VLGARVAYLAEGVQKLARRIEMGYRIFLSPPDVGPHERESLLGSFDSNWIAPVGPAILAFEAKLSALYGKPVVALSSGTAALHLSLIAAGVKPSDRVLVSNSTFAASLFPILYVGATPILVASEAQFWNADPEVAKEFLKKNAVAAAVITLSYGNPSLVRAWELLSGEFGFTLILDATEAVGSAIGQQQAGSYGQFAALSFNGNKIITTGGGGALVCPDEASAVLVKKLATQSKVVGSPHSHDAIGYNYAMPNLSAAIGVVQLNSLPEKVARRRAIFERYRAAFPTAFHQMQQADTMSNNWLSVFIWNEIAPSVLIAALKVAGIESRYAWLPMHQQPIAKDFQIIGDPFICEAIFQKGICLPSGSQLTDEQHDEIIAIIHSVLANI
jgi:pyridoxal phosphate-dependent aminotransferase EpsN